MFKINCLVYLFAVISIFIGAYKEFIIINTLIIIHELGHMLVAKIFKVEINKIYIYPLGGITKLNMDLNIHPLKEFIIIIAGPIFQFIAYYILINIFKKEIVEIYHYGILFFNLLPIYPLDGGKIINLIISSFLPFKKSLKISVYLSYLFIMIIIFKSNNVKLNLIITIILLIVLAVKEELKINYKYNKFILERYLNNYRFKKSKIINNENNLYRNKRHLLKINDKYYLEKEYFYKKQ